MSRDIELQNFRMFLEECERVFVTAQGWIGFRPGEGWTLLDGRPVKALPQREKNMTPATESMRQMYEERTRSNQARRREAYIDALQQKIRRDRAMNERPGLIGVAVPQREELERAESRGFWIGFFVCLGMVLFWSLLIWTVTSI